MSTTISARAALERVCPAAALIAIVVAAGLGCSGKALGEACAESSECASGLQCAGGVCALACETAFDCGDGFVCDDGECTAVLSELGDVCTRELDCGVGQRCALDAVAGTDGLIASSCQADAPGAGTAAACQSDDDCRAGLCSVGRCTQLCEIDDDCPLDLACVELPRLLAQGEGYFRGCLQGQGVLRIAAPISLPFQKLNIEVPGHARSFALLGRVDSDQRVGMSRLQAPDGELLYATPFSPVEYLENLIRYEPTPWTSAALVPNTPALELERGVYQAEVGSFLPAGGVGTAIPTVEILYKLDGGATLDVHFYFLNHEDHPCATAMGGRLSAAFAQASPEFKDQFVAELRTIFAGADIELGEVTYTDVLDRPDLDGLTEESAAGVGSITDGRPGVHVVFARSIDPAGLQALASGTPGAPRTGGTTASAIAVGSDTLCYRSWTELGRSTARTMAKQMGLFDSVDAGGVTDPIADSDLGDSNLMFFSEFGGTTLSAGQGEVLRRWPGLR